MRAYNTKDFRVSPQSNRQMAKVTVDNISGSKPSDVSSVVSYDGSGVTLSWKSAIDCDMYYVYQADTSEDLTGTLNIANAAASTSTVRLYLSGLTKDQTYYFAVVGYNKSTAAFTDSSDILRVKMTANSTSTTAEPSVKGLNVTSVTKNSISLSWTASEGASYYLISYTAGGVKNYKTSTATNITLTDLLNSTEYTIGVAIYNSSFFSQLSLYRAGVFGYITVVTDGNVPNDNIAVNNIAVTRSGDNLQLVWSDVAGATHYSVCHGTSNVYKDAEDVSADAQSPSIFSGLNLNIAHYY